MTRIRRLKRTKSISEYCDMLHLHQIGRDIVYSKAVDGLGWRIMYWTGRHRVNTIYSHSLQRGLELAIMYTGAKIV